VVLNGAVKAELEREVVVVGLVIEEVFLDEPALITEAEYELLKPMNRVHLHDVPDDGPAGDLNERFGTELGFFPQTCSLTAAKDHNFHRALPTSCTFRAKKDYDRVRVDLPTDNTRPSN